MDPRLSISAAAFDGYELPVVLAEIAALGAGYVELAFIQGYMDAFGEEAFSEKTAKTVRRDLAEAGLACFALSAHMDLSAAEAVGIFERRMAFAKSVGAGLIVTNAAPRFREKEFFQNIEALARKAEYLELIIGLENPGDGRENVVNCGETGAKTIQRIGSRFCSPELRFRKCGLRIFSRGKGRRRIFSRAFPSRPTFTSRTSSFRGGVAFYGDRKRAPSTTRRFSAELAQRRNASCR